MKFYGSVQTTWKVYKKNIYAFFYSISATEKFSVVNLHLQSIRFSAFHIELKLKRDFDILPFRSSLGKLWDGIELEEQKGASIMSFYVDALKVSRQKAYDDFIPMFKHWWNIRVFYGTFHMRCRTMPCKSKLQSSWPREKGIELSSLYRNFYISLTIKIDK